MKPVILVDGSSYLYRAYHGIPPLHTSDGRPTWVIRGVINMLRKLTNQYQPTHMAVIFDAPGKTFRNEIYPFYKTNRAGTPPELLAQIPPLVDIIKALGLPFISIDGVEADDVIGTLARRIERLGRYVLISTGDKDLAQLVCKRISLINTMTDTLYDEQAVINKFGVRPDQIADYLSLIGDAVDHIPGIPRLGAKTAVKLLAMYNDLDTIIANAASIPGAVGESFRENIKLLDTTRDLVALRCELDIPHTFEDLLIKEPNVSDLLGYYNELEFYKLIAELET